MFSKFKWITLAEWSPSIVAFVTFPLLARLLGAEGYGLWNQLAVISAMFVHVAQLGFLPHSSRWIAGTTDPTERKNHLGTILVLLVVSSLVAIGVFWGISYLKVFVWIVPYRELLALGIICLVLYPFLRMFWLSLNNPKLYFGITASRDLLWLVAIVCVWNIAGTIWDVLLSQILVYSLVILGGLLVLLKKQGELKWDATLARKYLKFGLPVLLSSYFAWVVMSFDRVVLGRYWPDAVVGNYAATYNILTPIHSLLTPIFSWVLVETARLKGEGKESALRSLFQSLFRLLHFVFLPLLMILWALSPVLLPLLAGRDFFLDPPYSFLMFIGFGFYILLHVAIYVLTLYDQPWQLLKNWFVAAAVSLGLNLMLIPSLGALGAALAFCVSFGVLTLLLFRVSRGYIAISWEPQTLLIPYGAALFFAAIGWLRVAMIFKAILLLAGSAIYFAIIFSRSSELRQLTRKMSGAQSE
jgi:O-antigen/teichoic acid export membrane protein